MRVRIAQACLRPSTLRINLGTLCTQSRCLNMQPHLLPECGWPGKPAAHIQKEPVSFLAGWNRPSCSHRGSLHITTELPEPRGSPTSALIWAGMLTNSGLEAKAVRFSTASISGAVAVRHFVRLSSEKSPSKA